MREFFFREI